MGLSIQGTALAPFECFLFLRGIKTMHLRVERAQENAEKVAAFLLKHSCVQGSAPAWTWWLRTRSFGDPSKPGAGKRGIDTQPWTQRGPGPQIIIPLSAPTSRRSFAIGDCDAPRGPQKSLATPDKAMLHCD